MSPTPRLPLLQNEAYITDYYVLLLQKTGFVDSRSGVPPGSAFVPAVHPLRWARADCCLLLATLCGLAGEGPCCIGSRPPVQVGTRKLRFQTLSHTHRAAASAAFLCQLFSGPGARAPKAFGERGRGQPGVRMERRRKANKIGLLQVLAWQFRASAACRSPKNFSGPNRAARPIVIRGSLCLYCSVLHPSHKVIIEPPR